MVRQVKLVAVVATLACLGGALTPAQAGNVQIPAQYYSLVLYPGDSFRYNGSEEATMTVDDITYTVQINPCNLYARCDFFSKEQLTAQFGDVDEFSQDLQAPPAHLDAFGGTTISTSFRRKWVANAVISRGEYLRLEMIEAEGGIFDAVSHTLYGTVIDKYKREERSSSSMTQYPSIRDLIEPGMPDPAVAGGSNTATATDAISQSEALGLSTWAVQTSESRHYQSPQIVQYGTSSAPNVVTLSQMIAVTDYGAYADAYACVKGRVYLTAAKPIENFDVVVTHP